MRIGACLWSLPEDPHEAAAWAKEAGFEAIDVDPGFAAGWDAEGGLPVASVAIAHLMPDGAALEAADDQAADAGAGPRARGLGRGGRARRGVCVPSAGIGG